MAAATSRLSDAFIDSTLPDDDRRGARREPANDLSEIRVASSRVPVTCLIRDMSDSGVGIEAATTVLPRRFLLTSFSRRFKVVCEVVWQNGRRFGLRYASPPKPLEKPVE